jgi:hypothetical protein
MKINEKLGFCLMDENHFISSLFTLRGSRRLPSASLLRACNSFTMAKPLNALHMKAPGSCKIQVLKWTLPVIFWGVLILTAYGGATKIKSSGSAIVIPPPAFEVEQTRSDPGRPVRSSGRSYGGPLFDTHAHLYPPHGAGKEAAVIDKGKLKEIIRLIKKLGVEHVIFMPTPNDGIRPHQRLGVVKRKMIKDLDKKRVMIFCGSNYIRKELKDLDKCSRPLTRRLHD